MPHLILEYSGNLTGFDVPATLKAANRAVLASGEVANPLDLKSRAVRQDTYHVGEPEEDPARHGFVYVHLQLLSGRTPAAKKAISQSLMEVIQAQTYPADVRVQFSVELRDMDRDSYGKGFRAATA